MGEWVDDDRLAHEVLKVSAVKASPVAMCQRQVCGDWGGETIYYARLACGWLLDCGAGEAGKARAQSVVDAFKE